MNNHLKRFFSATAVTMLAVVASGCNPLADPTQEIIAALDDAVRKLEDKAISWQRTLENTRDQLLREGQSTLSNEVSSVLTRAVSDAGMEARCFADFMRDRVKEDLVRLRARYTGEKLELNPVFCTPNPSSVNFDLVQSGRQDSIDIAGYNLDFANIEVILVDEYKQRSDVSFALGNPTRYIITLNLGKNGVPLTGKSNKIIFKLPGEERSVNVIQPRREEVHTFTPSSFSHLCPTHVGGDREFAGHGPRVSVSAQLVVKKDRELWVKLHLHAKETRRDWTEARKKWNMPLWTAPIGFKIIEFSPSSASSAQYIDRNHQLDTPSITGSALVRKFEVNGDTGGNDVGNCTRDDVYMNVYFNSVRVRYSKK